MRLDEYASNIYSQFGEDGMLRHIFEQIGRGHEVCVEFGAADGNTCSNTKALWEVGWEAVLVESDPNLYAALAKNTKEFNVHAALMTVVPRGPDSIDALLHRQEHEHIDLMSIDVDGIEFHIWEAMGIRPRVMVVEYNQSIPPTTSLCQSNLTDHVGASARALVDLAHRKGYELIGLNKGNLIFVVVEELAPFRDYERELDDLFLYDDLCYLATDQAGRSFIIGEPPWGLSMLGEPYVGEVIGEPIRRVGPYLDLVRAFERRYECQAVFVGQDWHHNPADESKVAWEAFNQVFSGRALLIIIDVTNQQEKVREGISWVVDIAQDHGYLLQIIEGLFVFTKGTT